MSGDTRIQAKQFVPDTIQAGPSPAVQGLAQYELGYHFYNGLGIAVTLVTRSGVQIRIPPLMGSRLRALVVRTTYGTRQNYGVGHGVIVDTGDLLNDEGLSTSNEAQVIDNALGKDEVRVGRGQPAHGVVDYFVTREELNRNNGAVFCTPLDLVISVLNPYYAPKHPYSRIGQRQALIGGDVSSMDSQGFGYVLRIIDRQLQFGDRYVNIGGEVYLIKAEVDNALADGVYLTTQVPANGSTDITLARSLFFEFASVDTKLKLYKTFQDALTLGDPKSERERELTERAHQIKLVEADLREEKLRRDAQWEQQKRDWEIERETAKQAIMQREERLKVLDQVQSEREQEITRREQHFRLQEHESKQRTLILKDEHDRRATSRKEVLEVIKHIPALVSGLVTLYAVFKTLKK